MRAQIEGYMREVPCSTCHGARLNPLSLAVTVDGRTIDEVCGLSIRDSAAALGLTGAVGAGSGHRRSGAQGDQRPAQVPARRGAGVSDPGPLGGHAQRGEAQRLRLASQIGSGLVGVLNCCWDEPSIGLHQRDNRRLIDTLERMRDLGNTVLVVEHDEETVRVADYVVDIGPGAGRARRHRGPLRHRCRPDEEQGFAHR